MADPILLSENLLSAIAFPSHTLVGDEEPAGHEGWHVARGSRDNLTNYWTGITLNQQRTLTATFDRVRAFNCLFLDRGHNQAGVSFFLEASFDASTWQVCANPTVPTGSAPGALSNTNGVVTEEGAFGVLFPTNAGAYVRLRFPAMGAGLSPIIVGAYLGLAWDPSYFFTPWDEDQDDFGPAEVLTEWAWRGRGPAPTMRAGTINIRLPSDAAYELARYHLGGHWRAGRPMWICYDQAQADRTFLAVRPGGSHLGIGYEPNWFPRKVQFPYVELDPLRTS